MVDKLSDLGEILFRQIHPSFVHLGDPSSQAFAPTPKDSNKLSVDRSALTTSADSYSLFTANGHTSAAVYGLTVGEFGAEDLACHADPLAGSERLRANPAHAYADYSPFTGGQQKNKAKRLKQKALARGILYAPPA
jgi:hypothetical protein